MNDGGVRCTRISPRDLSGLPCVDFVLQPRDVARTDLNRRGEFAATNASAEGHAIGDVAGGDEVIESEQALHGVSRKFRNARQGLGGFAGSTNGERVI